MTTLVANVKRQLSAPLALLVTSVLADDHTPAARADMHAAAQHIHLALLRLARIESPARLRPDTSVGEPVQPPARTGERCAPSSGAVFSPAVTESGGDLVEPVAGASFRLPLRPAAPRFGEGEHRLVGRCT